MTDGATDRRRDAPPRRSRPIGEASSPSIAREVAKFVVVSLLAMVVFAAASLPLLRHLGRSEAVRDARDTARLAAAGIVEPNLSDALLTGDASAVERLDRVVHERVLSDRIVRVKIWTADGRIVYSDEPRLIGSMYPLGDDEEQALASGAVHAELSDLDHPENRYERAEGELLEVYSRVRTPSGTPVLFELYERFDSVRASGRRIWLSFLPALLAALVLLWVVQVPLAYRLASRVRRGHEERELLLQRTLDASNDERRRIAADLHDGVVQDLAGISYALEAAQSSPAAVADRSLSTTLREGAAVTRASIQRLRALLVEIHPPNLRAAGLEAALSDLVAPLRRRGIDTSLDVDAPLDLHPDSEALLFRAAREAIRNVLEHADATWVGVRVERTEDLVRLTVEDNGSGFDADARDAAREARHVGLSLLEEHAAHVDGRLSLRSSPGQGTTLTLEVPA